MKNTFPNEKDYLLNQISEVANSNTDFESGFDCLFKFMAENPQSETTERFIEYHIIEMNSPSTESGPDFTYLIGKDFIPKHWVAKQDLFNFLLVKYNLY